MSRAALWLAVATFCGATGVDRAAAQTGLRPALVMPFHGAGSEPRLVWLSEGVATLIGDGLTASGRPAFTRADRVRIFEQLQLPEKARLSYATIIRVAEVVDADSVITGQLALAGDRLTIRARQLDVDSGRSEPEVIEQGTLADLFALCDRVVRRLAGTASQAAAPRTGPDAPPPLDAFESYIKGLLAENPDTKIRFLNATLARHPRYPRAELALWDVHTDQQAYAKALEAADAVPAASRLRLRARFLGARSLIQLKRYDEAFGRLRALTDERPAGAIYNNLGIVQLRRGWTPQTGQPVAYFNKAVEAEPANADYLFNLGYAYWLERDAQAAIYFLREVVRRNPADGEAHIVLSAALQATGSSAEAGRERDLARNLSSKYSGETVPRGLERVSEDLNPVLSQHVDSVVVKASQDEHARLSQFHFDRGQRLLEDQQSREAIAEFRKALYLAPYDARTNLWLGRAYARAGRLREAVDTLKVSIWSLDSVEARVALAAALAEMGDAATARTHALRALQMDPASGEARALFERLDRRPASPK